METIFVGSSGEGLNHARAIVAELAKRSRPIQLHAWWHEGVFRQGETFIESLEREARWASAAIIVFTPDDPADVRGIEQRVPRDNVLFEYGLFVNALGRARVALVQLDDARIPSDLRNVTVISLSTSDQNVFLDSAVQALDRWLAHLPQPLLPMLHDQLQASIPVLKQLEDSKRDRFDRSITHLVQTLLLSAISESQGVNDAFVALAEWELGDSISISAADATGPAGWLGPAPYRYIASQVREYLFANRVDGRWCPVVHGWLDAAMQRAFATAHDRFGMAESATRFDNTGEVRFEVGEPRLQYSRILLWTEDELADPVADAVISLHEAFSIPLFYLPVQADSREKQIAFVAFEKRSRPPCVLYGERADGYSTKDRYSRNGMVPRLGNALSYYQTLLSRDDLAFALDARTHLLHRAAEASSRPIGLAGVTVSES